ACWPDADRQATAVALTPQQKVPPDAPGGTVGRWIQPCVLLARPAYAGPERHRYGNSFCIVSSSAGPSWVIFPSKRAMPRLARSAMSRRWDDPIPAQQLAAASVRRSVMN